MRILVIGGTRFIGPLVTERLVRAGHRVVLWHRGHTEPVYSHVPHLHADRRDLLQRRKLWQDHRPDVVLDMIARTERDARSAVDAFRGRIGRLVVISSIDVYRAYGLLFRLGDTPTPAPESEPIELRGLTEAEPLRESRFPRRKMASGPLDWRFDYDKVLVEEVFRSEPSLRATVLRLPFVYGPGDYRHRVARYLGSMDQGASKIVLPAAEAAWRSTRGYVDNVVAAIARAVESERASGQVYNVGDEEACTEAQWVSAIGRAAKWEGQVVLRTVDPNAEPALDWAHHLAVDTRRIREELGHEDEVTWGDGLAATIAWERQRAG